MHVTEKEAKTERLNALKQLTDVKSSMKEIIYEYR